MPFTYEQLTALEEAIAQGAMQVKFQDKEVRYQSVNDMLLLRDVMRRALGISNQKNARIYTVFDKGL